MVKTRGFSKKTYLGDPVNVINLFNRFEVDEIVLLDIGATAKGDGPDLELVESVADECWVPLTYGGGIRSVYDVENLVKTGVEKVVFGSAISSDLTLLTEASKSFGVQCIVGSLDVKRTFFGKRAVVTNNAGFKIKGQVTDRARALEDAGAGEILLQDVSRDGEMKGYDLDLVQMVTEAVSVPVVACGGAGKRADLAGPILDAGASASAAGSLFVFSGEERGVLINFPERKFLEDLLAPAQKSAHRSTPGPTTEPAPMPGLRPPLGNSE